MSRKPSRKRSDTSESPEPLRFFLDRNLGGKIIAEALREAGVDVVVHDDLFEPSTPDEDWLQYAGEHGMIVLSRDRRIRHHDHELQALLDAKVRAF